MFLKQEKPEMNDFERKKKFGSKGKISLRKYIEKANLVLCTVETEKDFIHFIKNSNRIA